jgi:hypothetical protein
MDIFVQLYVEVRHTQWICEHGLKDVKAKVNVNGKPFEEFDIERGVRQRCPLAPYLFFIVGEALNAMIKKDEWKGRILGIKLPWSKERQLIA